MDSRTTNPIEKLDFGMDSAETEDKAFLEKAFLYTTLFDRIRSGKKHLVLGRKGAGKTAICLKLYDYLDKQGARVSFITPKDLQKFKHDMLEKVSLNSAESSLLAWKYVFLVQLGQYLLEDAKSVHGDNYLSWPESLRQIRKLIVQYEGGKSSWIEKTFKIISSIKPTVKTVFGDISIDKQSQGTLEHDFDDKLASLTDSISVSLQSLSITPIYLLVDKIDELWDPIPENKLLIIGLLRAMKEVLEELSSVHIIVFLRSDIYESLEFHDSDKFHTMEDHIQLSKRELQEMLIRRAELSTGFFHNVSAPQNAPKQSDKSLQQSLDLKWEMFFTKRISFEYLLRYTFMRPRDLIQLCNLCRDKAHNNKHIKIEESDIDEALPDYSQWKLQDLRDEYSIQYPFLETLFLMVFYKTLPRLNRQLIKHSFEPLKARLNRSYDPYYFEPLDKLLQILYNIGFLGAADKETVRYSFRGEKVIIPYVSQFEIHPVFRWALATSSTTVHSTGYSSPGVNTLDSLNIEEDLLEDYTARGTVRSTTPTPMLNQPDNEGINRLREVIIEAYPHGELEPFLVPLHLPYEIMGRGSLSRQVQELIAYCIRHNRYQDLVRQILIDHPERAKDIL